MVQDHTIVHTVGINYLVCPIATRYSKKLLLITYSEDLKVIFLELVRSILSMECAGFGQFRHVELTLYCILSEHFLVIQDSAQRDFCQPTILSYPPSLPIILLWFIFIIALLNAIYFLVCL